MAEQIPRFPRLSRNIAAQLVQKPKLSLEIEVARCIQCIVQQASNPVYTYINKDEALDGIDNPAVSIILSHEQITLFLSTQRLEESVTAFVRAVQAAEYMSDSKSPRTALVQEWREVLMMRDQRVIPDIRWRVRHVILGQEFARRLRYYYTSISIVDCVQCR